MFMFHFFLVYEEYIQGQMERQGVGGWWVLGSDGSLQDAGYLL